MTIRPSLLSRQAVAAIVRNTLGSSADDDVCALAHRATGGNPFYLREFLRALERAGDASGLRAVTLREAIRALGPTIDFLPRTQAFALGAGAPQENTAKQTPNAVSGSEAHGRHRLLFVLAAGSLLWALVVGGYGAWSWPERVGCR